MNRWSFFKTSGAFVFTTGLGFNKAMGFVPAHSWEKYDFGSGLQGKDRLYQGHFPQYYPEPAVHGCSMLMNKIPSAKVFGMGMTIYICYEHGHPKTSSVRQAMILLPKGIDWKRLRIKAELDVKNITYPVEWTGDEKIHGDGSLTLNPGG